MRNVWKGLIVGGLTGATAGLLADMADGRAPEASEWLRQVTERAAEWLQQSDLPERVREAAQHLVDSERAEQAREAAAKVAANARGKLTEAAREAQVRVGASDIPERIGTAAREMRDKISASAPSSTPARGQQP